MNDMNNNPLAEECYRIFCNIVGLENCVRRVGTGDLPPSWQEITESTDEFYKRVEAAFVAIANETRADAYVSLALAPRLSEEQSLHDAIKLIDAAAKIIVDIKSRPNNLTN